MQKHNMLSKNFYKHLLSFRTINFLPILFSLIIFLIYSKYLTTLTWGTDYAGYINLAKALSDGKLSDYVESRLLITSYTTTTPEPVYTPIGFPIIILLTSFIHNWNVLIIKLITPLICIGLYFLITNMFNKNYEKIITFTVLLNPFYIDQFRNITTELVALFFLLLGIHFSKFKFIYFIVSVLIRPSFLVFVSIYIFFDYLKKRNIKEFLNFLIVLISIQIFINYYLKINFYGMYMLTDSGNSNFALLFENLLNFELNNLELIIYEFGRIFSTISHPINTFIGISMICVLLFINNFYGYMSLGFLCFHIVWIYTDYARFFLPLVVLFSLSVFTKFRSMNLNNLTIKLLLIFSLLLLVPYGYLINYRISLLDTQRGPYQTESQDLFRHINNNYEEGLFSFHSARVFTLFTGLESYKIQNTVEENTIIICELEQKDCLVPPNYKKVYNNDLYKIYEPYE